MPPHSQPASPSSPQRARPASIAAILRERYGDAYAEGWLRGDEQATAASPPPEATTEPVRRPENLPRPSPLPQDSKAVEALSERLTAPVEDHLHPTARTIYGALHRIALEVAARRRYSPKVSTVSYHLPTELLAHELSMSRTTLWTHVKSLKASGLVDQRGHTTTANGKRVKDGSVWSVKLRPLQGKSARLTYEELTHSWRDLEADIEAGSTVYNWIEQSVPTRMERDNYEVLVAWASSPGQLKSPLEVTVQPTAAHGIEALLDVPWAPKDDRNSMVDGAARAVAAHLGDSSLDFYRYLIWQLLRRFDQGEDRIHNVYEMILRAGVDRVEGFASRAGALFVSRLKGSGLWDWMRGTVLTRVGGTPG